MEPIPTDAVGTSRDCVVVGEVSPGARRPGFKIQLQTYQLGSLVPEPQRPSSGEGEIISQIVRVVRQEKACAHVLLVEGIQSVLEKERKTLELSPFLKKDFPLFILKLIAVCD